MRERRPSPVRSTPAGIRKILPFAIDPYTPYLLGFPYMGVQTFYLSDRHSKALSAYREREGISQSEAVRKALDFWPPLWISGRVEGLVAIVTTCSGKIRMGGV